MRSIRRCLSLLRLLAEGFASLSTGWRGTAGAPKASRQGEALRLCTLVLLLLSALARPAAARQSTPSFGLDGERFTIRCATLDSATAVITWTTASEEHVTGFKVHRTALTGPAESRWVNPFPLAATGAGSEYRVLDGSARPGIAYRYRLYGFEESGRLSLATWVVLAEGVRPWCAYLPLISVGRSEARLLPEAPLL